MVKPKTGILHIFTGRAGTLLAWVLPVLSILTFISSWVAIYPSNLVERWYARALFPNISYLAGRFADSVSFSWLDLGVPVAIVLLVFLIRTRRWRLLSNLAASLYLIFFWSWGINYHRPPLNSKLQLDPVRMKSDAMDLFARHAAAEMNRLYTEKQRQSYDEAPTREEAAR